MKYGNIYKVLIMAVLAAIILSLSMRLFKNPEESKEPIVQPETAAELTEEDITAETERNQTTMATFPDEVEAEGGIRSQKCIRRGKKRSMQHVILQIQKAQLM